MIRLLLRTMKNQRDYAPHMAEHNYDCPLADLGPEKVAGCNCGLGPLQRAITRAERYLGGA